MLNTVQTRFPSQLDSVVFELQRQLSAVEAALNAAPLELTLESPWEALSGSPAIIWRFGRVRVLSGILKSDATQVTVANFPEADSPLYEADGMAGTLSVSATDDERTVRVSPAGVVYFNRVPPTYAGGRYYLPAITWLAKGN